MDSANLCSSYPSYWSSFSKPRHRWQHFETQCRFSAWQRGERGESKSRGRLAISKEGAEFLSAFAKLRKLAVSVVMPFLGTTRLPLRRISKELNIWVFFENLSGKIQVSLKSDKNNGYFTWKPYGPEVDSASNRNEYQEYFLRVKAAGE